MKPERQLTSTSRGSGRRDRNPELLKARRKDNDHTCQATAQEPVPPASCRRRAISYLHHDHTQLL
eukprot:CAMPEP_0115116036 /NCGR_PEP_ID=MMETSP0227-20121206/43044_1 /TAXON_ID=89957 /ORGANISM="Polarella glacialis, Strain CCMP 1383" /LENGTH=64 /DNA_ID=CAMNT_0002516813 /DNA_START=280 /DNA_END=471 /DNA_ORIENTATION=-